MQRCGGSDRSETRRMILTASFAKDASLRKKKVYEIREKTKKLRIWGNLLKSTFFDGPALEDKYG